MTPRRLTAIGFALAAMLGIGLALLPAAARDPEAPAREPDLVQAVAATRQAAIPAPPAAAARAPTPPPKLAATAAATGTSGFLLQRDPTAPDYDPAKLMLLGRGSAADLFELEPRNPGWASRVESHLTTFAHRLLDHLEYANVESAECRSASCTVTVSYPSGDELKDREIAMLTQVLGLGPVMSTHAKTEQDGRSVLTIGVLYPPEDRDPATAQAWSEARLKEKLDELRDNAEVKAAFRLPPP
jgi:hypothetical protein